MKNPAGSMHHLFIHNMNDNHFLWRMDKTGLIWTIEIDLELYFTLKIPELNWINQNYSSFDHNGNEID